MNKMSSSSSLPVPISISSNSNTLHAHINSSSTSLQPTQAPSQTKTIRYRLSQLCREGQPHVAHQLFDKIPRPTTVLWNTIIIGFICNNMSDEAILLYARMLNSSSSLPDPYTYSSTLKACAETRQLRIGRAVHCHILRSRCEYPNPPSRIVCNSLLNMYVSCCSFYGSSRYDSLVCNVFDTIRKKQNVVAWNIIISWYVRRERFFEAFRHFVMLIKTGLKPTVVSFVNVFPAIRDVCDANVLYGMLIKMGGEYVYDMFAVSSAVFVYSELGELDSARKVFDQCLERNTEVWNTMISGYVQNNRPLEALELFMEIAVKSEKHNVVMVDDVSFLSALTAASQLQQLNFAKRLHAYSIKNLSDLSTMILNAVVVMYSRCNSVQTSFKIFNIMHERDNVSWNTMISSLVQNGLDEEGLMLVQEMQKQGFVIDYVTITSLLSASSNLRNQEAGKQTHGYLLRHEIQFEGMESYLIDMYSKSGLVEAARVLFETSCTQDRDLATWNAMIAGNTQNGLIEQAFIVFRQMLDQTVAPNAVTLASILPACNPLGSLGLGKQLHAYSIRSCLNHNVFVDSALVDMYSKLGSIHYAEDVFANSPERNSVTYTNMILGYGQHGLGEKALNLFYSMREYDISPDPITMVAVLSACSYTGLVDEGLRIFESMERDYGIRPSSEHYCCITDMLGRVGRVVEAYNFVKNLGEKGNVLGIWGSLLAACRTHGEFQLGRIVAKKFNEMEKLNNISGYNVLLSNMYAEEGNWESVNRVREGMQENGSSKEVGCSWIDVAGYVNYFASRDQKHPQSNNIYSSLEELGTNMKDAGYRSCTEL
ncbi:pentatricopeptide repeat-containing protein At3g22150, chloroplastic [Apium graveolens]|uniref:pentatricopeptide repeat-containing protein At3g22150, chloroplastic n=1 Tax=Apium graveolens TaxID=4045 RepID=UPI003D793F30